MIFLYWLKVRVHVYCIVLDLFSKVLAFDESTYIEVLYMLIGVLNVNGLK
jgi:hypothetical protein